MDSNIKMSVWGVISIDVLFSKTKSRL